MSNLTSLSTEKLNDMADVLSTSIREIQDRGHMSMSYMDCAIGSVQLAAKEYGQYSLNDAIFDSPRSGEVLRLLDRLADERGGHYHPFGCPHLGSAIESYGEDIVDWDMKKMLEVFYNALDCVQAELHLRTLTSAPERELVCA